MITANKTSLYVVVFSWLVFFVSVFSPLTDNDYSYFSLNAFVFFVVSFLFFYVSFFSSSCVFRFKRALPSVEKVVFLFFLFLFFAVVFRVIDRFYLRAVDDIFSFKSYRGAREAGSNLASVLAGVFMPMVFVLFSCLVENRRVVGKSVFYIGSFFVFILFFDVVLSGSRGIMLILLCLTLGGSLRLKNMLYVGPLLLFFFSAFFMYRFYSVSASGDIYHIMHGISNDGYAYFVPVSSFFSEAFDDGFMAIVFFPIVQANQYLAHGFFEFLYTYSNGNGSVNGLANFGLKPQSWFLWKALNRLGQMFITHWWDLLIMLLAHI